MRRFNGWRDIAPIVQDPTWPSGTFGDLTWSIPSFDNASLKLREELGVDELRGYWDWVKLCKWCIKTDSAHTPVGAPKRLVSFPSAIPGYGGDAGSLEDQGRRFANLWARAWSIRPHRLDGGLEVTWADSFIFQAVVNGFDVDLSVSVRPLPHVDFTGLSVPVEMTYYLGYDLATQTKDVALGIVPTPEFTLSSVLSFPPSATGRQARVVSRI